MQQRFFVLRQIGVDHQIKTRQINAARRNIGGNTNPRAPITHGLQRVGALVLAKLARQRHHGHAAVVEFGRHVVNSGTRGTEYQRILGLVITQQIDDGIFTIGRFDHQSTVFNIAVLFGRAFGLNAHGVVLIGFGQQRNRARNCGRKHQGAAGFGRGVQNKFQIIAKTQIQHFVGLVQHHATRFGQIQRTARDVIAQTPRCANHDVHTAIQRAPFGAGIHAANARAKTRPGFGEKPLQFAHHLQGQLTGWGDD